MSKFKPENVKNNVNKTSDRFFVYAQAEGITTAEASAMRSEIIKLMSDINEDIEFLTETYVLIEQALFYVKGFAIIGAAAPLLPITEKIISDLESLIANTKPFLKLASQIKNIQKFVDNLKIVKNFSALQNLIRTLTKFAGAVRAARATLGPLFKWLNMGFIALAIVEIKKKNSEIEALKNKKIDDDIFESNQEKISKLENEKRFEWLRLATGLGSYVPGAQKVVAIADGLMLFFNPENIRNWGFLAEGFKGGEKEARRYFMNSSMPLYKDKKELYTLTYSKNNPKMREKLNNNKIARIIENANMKIFLENKEVNIKTLQFKDYPSMIINHIQNKEDANAFKNWHSADNQNLLGEYFYYLRQGILNHQVELNNKYVSEIKNLLRQIGDQNTSNNTKFQLKKRLKEVYDKLTKFWENNQMPKPKSLQTQNSPNKTNNRFKTQTNKPLPNLVP